MSQHELPRSETTLLRNISKCFFSHPDDPVENNLPHYWSRGPDPALSGLVFLWTRALRSLRVFPSRLFVFFAQKPPEYSGIFQNPEFFSFFRKERRGNERKSRTFRVKRGMKYVGWGPGYPLIDGRKGCVCGEVTRYFHRNSPFEKNHIANRSSGILSRLISHDRR